MSPANRPLTEQQKTLISVVVGIGAIVLGIHFLIRPNISYAPGDFRGGSAYAQITGGMAIGIGILVLVSARVPAMPAWNDLRRAAVSASHVFARRGRLPEDRELP